MSSSIAQLLKFRVLKTSYHSKGNAKGTEGSRELEEGSQNKMCKNEIASNHSQIELDCTVINYD
jgi:hypothetical protein